MKQNIFISYPSSETIIIENLRSELKALGITAWVYSEDKTLAEDTWKEIKTKIYESDFIVFAISKDTLTAAGQKEELKLVLDKIKPHAVKTKLMPIFIRDTAPAMAPEELRNINGEFLDGSNVKTVALKIAKKAFPQLLKTKNEISWKYPIPGEWLKISNLDKFVEEDFELGDKLYFRTISPMGLFECYAPKIEGLFWIDSENVSASHDIEIDKDLENEIPDMFLVNTMFKMQQKAWDIINQSENS